MERVSKTEEIKYKLYFDDVTKKSIKEHNRNWPQIPDDLHRILLIVGSSSGKTNLLFNLIIQQPDIDNFFINY